MLREVSRSESVLRLRVEEFIATFRPHQVPSAYELLFIPTNGETQFVPPPAQMSLCLREWAALLNGVCDHGALFEANWVEAAEVTFTYLVCAGRAGFNLPWRETLQRIVTRTRRVEATFGAVTVEDGSDALQRISAVADEIVAQGYAVEPFL